jgi:hypothetical protein
MAQQWIEKLEEEEVLLRSAMVRLSATLHRLWHLLS